MGWGWIVTLMPYGENGVGTAGPFISISILTLWSRYELRNTWYTFYLHLLEGIYILNRRELHRQLYRTPDQFAQHIRHTAGATIMEVATSCNSCSTFLTDYFFNSPYRLCMGSKCLPGRIHTSTPPRRLSSASTSRRTLAHSWLM
jgi:hypothetical protein